MKNRLREMTEFQVNFLFEDDDFYDEYEKIILDAEKITFENFNNLNNDFEKDENIEYFDEKRRLTGFYLITLDSLVESFVKNIQREPFVIEKKEFVSCDQNLKPMVIK